jgi:hypothetical protein
MGLLNEVLKGRETRKLERVVGTEGRVKAIATTLYQVSIAGPGPLRGEPKGRAALIDRLEASGYAVKSHGDNLRCVFVVVPDKRYWF